MTSDAEKMMAKGDSLYDSRNFKRALQCFEEAEKLGWIEAQVNIGHMYANGLGTLRNKEKAVFWYKKAVKNNISAGAYNLANLYRKQGSRRWMIFWAKRAVEMGDDEAEEDFLKE